VSQQLSSCAVFEQSELGPQRSKRVLYTEGGENFESENKNGCLLYFDRLYRAWANSNDIGCLGQHSIVQYLFMVYL
jgi:hypothetical protein